MDKNKYKYAKKNNVKKSNMEQIDERKRKIQLLVDEINKKNLEMENIQKKFNFKIPDYILDEMIEQKGKNNNVNLIALINLAIVNGRITKENGKILKNACQIKENNV